MSKLKQFFLQSGFPYFEYEHYLISTKNDDICVCFPSCVISTHICPKYLCFKLLNYQNCAAHPVNFFNDLFLFIFYLIVCQKLERDEQPI